MREKCFFLSNSGILSIGEICNQITGPDFCLSSYFNAYVMQKFARLEGQSLCAFQLRA